MPAQPTPNQAFADQIAALIVEVCRQVAAPPADHPLAGRKYTVAEFADATHLSPQTVKKLIRTGRIRAYRVAGERGDLRIPADQLDVALIPVDTAADPAR